MRGRVGKVAALAAGAYTPFLAADWGEAERELVRQWRGGDDLREEAAALTEAMRAKTGAAGVATNLGRAALQIVLEALELPADSEVIVPSYACAGVAVPVVQAGLRPVFADVDDDLNLSAESVEQAAGSTVRALVLPHLAGVWARDAELIAAWARERGIVLVEDVAQAQGLHRGDRAAGSLGDVSIFSFGGGKVLFGPGGGFASVRDAELATRIESRRLGVEPRASVSARLERFVSRFASTRNARARRTLLGLVAARFVRAAGSAGPAGDDPHRFDVWTISGIEAALARAGMRRLDALVAAQQRHAERWRGLLAGVRGLRLAPGDDNVATHLWARFDGDDSARAAAFRTVLNRYGVETETLYVPLHQRPEFARYRAAPLPNSDRLWPTLFALPTRPSLDESDWRRAQAAVTAFAS